MCPWMQDLHHLHPCPLPQLRDSVSLAEPVECPHASPGCSIPGMVPRPPCISPVLHSLLQTAPSTHPWGSPCLRPPSHPPPAPHLHLKSQEPAARRTLFGCQSRLSTVERMGFLMCLQTHLCGEGLAAEGQHHHPQSPPAISGGWLRLVRVPNAPGAALGHRPALAVWA